jgi:acetyl esterase/lipase
VHIEAGSTERLIDDARQLAERARQAGVAATLEVTEEAVHAFPATAPQPPQARSACSGWAGISRRTSSPVRAVSGADIRGPGVSAEPARASKQAFCRLL